MTPACLLLLLLYLGPDGGFTDPKLKGGLVCGRDIRVQALKGQPGHGPTILVTKQGTRYWCELGKQTPRWVNFAYYIGRGYAEFSEIGAGAVIKKVPCRKETSG